MMPALFLGHGNPMNAVSNNAYTKAWAALGKSVSRLRAVLAISAHWYKDTPGALPCSQTRLGVYDAAREDVKTS